MPTFIYAKNSLIQIARSVFGAQRFGSPDRKSGQMKPTNTTKTAPLLRVGVQPIVGRSRYAEKKPHRLINHKM
jgi:hypothetical protein